MWSFSSSSQSNATTNPPAPSSLRFFHVHTFVNTAKELFQKVKDAPFFRHFHSQYIPYEGWRSLYMNNDLSNMASSSGGGSKDSTVLYDYEFVGIRRKESPNTLLEMDDPSVDSSNTEWLYRESENADISNGLCFAFQKDRSPGSTIETKSKGNTEDSNDHFRGKDESREPQVEERVDSLVETVEHVLDTSTGSSRNGSSRKGSHSRSWKQRRRRRTLSKLSFRLMLHRAYQKMKRAVATKAR